MSKNADTKNLGEPVGVKDASPLWEFDEERDVTKPSERRVMRVYIGKKLVNRLVDSGVPDDVVHLTRRVNALLEYVLSSHQTDMVTLTDVVTIQQALVDRIEELTATNIALAKVLYDLSAVVEVDRILGTFKSIAMERMPKDVIPVPSTPDPKPVNTR